MTHMVVLGGGPAGVTAALRARELGAEVTLIERNQLGGTCTNDGCVPTRVLAHTARLLRGIRQFKDYGILLDHTPRLDFAAVIKRTQQVVYEVHEKKQLLNHLENVGAQVLVNAGAARFTGPHSIRLEDGRTIEGDMFTVCVGGSPRTLPIAGIEHAVSHSDVWALEDLPASVAIVGCGATGCQLGYVLREFGAEVTLLDIAPRILPGEDAIVAETMQAAFAEQGIGLRLGLAGIESLERIDEETIRMRLAGDEALEAEMVVFSVGWPGNIDHLGLEAAGITRDGSYIKVGDDLQTSQPHIYAAGDITGRMMLVQSASHQARVAVENALLDKGRTATHELVPHGGFTNPEYAGVGLREQDAPTHYAIASVPYADLDRAVIDGHTRGFCKLIVNPETRLIEGAHVVGEQAVEVVQIVTAAMAGRMPIEQVAEIEFAYPTYSAIIGLAARQIARQVGAVAVAQPWRALTRVAEWERRDPQ